MKTDKITKACDYLTESHNAQFAAEYGEPGYTNTTRGVILANWNNVPRGLADWLESCGFSLEWSDEWEIDYSGNCKAWRTSPDSYGWESSVVYIDGEMLTRDDSHAEIIDALANTDKGQPVHCLPSWIESETLESEGYVLIQGELESGFFPGQTDNPAEFQKRAFDTGAESFIVRKVENSQFYCRFECWARFDEPVFDRFDICAAYAQLESDYNVGGWLQDRPSNLRRMESCGVQLARMGYRPGAGSPMNRNAWAVYRAAAIRMRLVK